MDLSGIIFAYVMIEAFVYCSKIVINDSLSEHQDPPSGINCSCEELQVHGKISLGFSKIFYHREKWFSSSSVRR